VHKFLLLSSYVLSSLSLTFQTTMIDSLPPVLALDTEVFTECVVLIVHTDIVTEKKAFIGES